MDAAHPAVVQTVEDEYYLSIPHEMRRDHYISFLAAVSGDRLQLVKLYPEAAPRRVFKRAVLTRSIFIAARTGCSVSPPANAGQGGALTSDAAFYIMGAGRPAGKEADCIEWKHNI